MYDLEVSSLSNHEKKVLNALAKFVNTHQPGASLRAIDDIVLSYVIGVLEDITSDDEFDVDSFVEMIGAYVPGFETIEVAVVCEWVFALSSQLLEEDGDDVPKEVSLSDSEPEVSSLTATSPLQECNTSCQQESPDTQTNSDQTSISNMSDSENLSKSRDEDDNVVSEDTLSKQEEDLKVPDQNEGRTEEEEITSDDADPCQQILEVVPDASLEEVRESLSQSGGDLEQAVEVLMERMVLREKNKSQKKEHPNCESFPDSQVVFITKSKRSEQKRKRQRRSKAGKENDVTLQDEDKKSDVKPNKISDKDVNRDGVQHLMELFPAASSLDAQQCLAIAKGDVEGAAQLLLEGINSGEIQPKTVYPKFQKPKAVDEKKQRDLLLQKYAFVDTEDEKREHRPFLPKPSKKKMVRYYDSKPVTMKGERFFEVKDS